ncbi:winged helix-turn-helix domain-containing protein [Polyangium sorediatum]|uniref:Response regulator transcription factor n=1 Tax=Polyangium sorediatum TaxID=889274 RepID=A0ABT6P1F1_9BACT|nr:response regulator transcription factor [Polyangium sorediatum]MDI1434422.1 response regulator transcription factor [Polyangium sorediatum]
MPHILIVEDEPAIAESLAYALRRDGFGVTLAGTLAGAERSLDAASLVLLDLMLPDGSGFDLIGKVRRSGLGTPIIVLTSRDDEADRVAALETGADDYVTKPFSTREIVARVRAVLRRVAPPAPLSTTPPPAAAPTPAPPPAATSATPSTAAPQPLSVDEATRRAYVHDREVELTRVEFDLLACLLAAPGRVFTRAQLIDRVWGDGFAISDRTIDSHVKGLRRKVESAGGNPAFIETVRGVGYRVTDRPAAPPPGTPDAP